MNRRANLVLMMTVSAAAILATGWWGARPISAQPAGGGPATAPSRPAGTSAPASAPATTSAPALRAVHVFVSGRVQGVGFRAWTVLAARELKLTGWVKNLTDGRVEAVIEGPADGVAAILERLKTGPDTAKVTDVKAADQGPTGEFKDFQQR